MTILKNYPYLKFSYIYHAITLIFVVFNLITALHLYPAQLVHIVFITIPQNSFKQFNSSFLKSTIIISFCNYIGRLIIYAAIIIVNNFSYLIIIYPYHTVYIIFSWLEC